MPGDPCYSAHAWTLRVHFKGSEPRTQEKKEKEGKVNDKKYLFHFTVSEE